MENRFDHFQLPFRVSRYQRRVHGVMAAMLMLTSLGQSSTIFWGSEFGSTLLTSSGQTLDSSFSFEVGTFVGGFVPTYENTFQWTANWQVFDRAYDPTPADQNDGDPEGWNVPDQFFVGTVEHNALSGSESPDANPADVFAQGETAYLWVYNSKSIVPGSEWALVLDGSDSGDAFSDWLFPNPSEPSTTSYDWQLADADNAVIGGVNGFQGEGEFSFNPGSFDLQTHAVPEPGSAFLLLLSVGVWLIRRTGRTAEVTP